MASLLPPSPSVSPRPNASGENKNSRQSMGPTSRNNPVGLSVGSPRPGGVSGSARPTSELVGGNGLFQTPEAEALDAWFENLQNYEVTLEEMAAASLDVNFKEELSAIEQWFKVLSEAERTAALYSLLQHSTQVQIRFFITVLQQMARADPMTALLSPAMNGSMQSQMEAKLASMNLKSPGFTASPTTRNFNIGPSRTSSGDNFLSPDSATLQGQSNMDAANTLAQQRAKLKASNAAHRISAPILATSGADNRNTWGSGASQLSQVAERPSSPGQEITLQPPPPGSRPKSTDFSGAANSFRAARPNEGIEGLSPIVGDSWASMVNTPLIPMFQNTNKDQQRNGQNLDAAVNKLNDWSAGNRVPLMEDPKKYRRPSKASSVVSNSDQHSEDQQSSGERRGFRNVSGTNNGPNHNANGNQPGPGNWGSTLRSPALPAGIGRFNDEGGLNSAGAGIGGFNVGLGSPGIGMGLPSGGMLGGMQPLSPFGMNMNMLNMMGMTPEAQLLAAQMAAAAGQFSPLQMAALQQQQQQQAANQRVNRNARSPGIKSSASGRADKRDEEEVDPKLLEDIPGWLRSLRLHKYTPNFEGMSWRDMVILDEVQLEAKGVAALGARRKMLKTFEVVRKKMNIELPVGATTTTSTTLA